MRLDEIGVDELEEVIVEAWLVQAPKRLAKEYAEAHGYRGVVAGRGAGDAGAERCGRGLTRRTAPAPGPNVYGAAQLCAYAQSLND